MTLKICSHNVRGLGEYKKRKDIFNKFQKDNNDIIMLQETHSTHKTSGLWRNQWGAECYFSDGDTNARGVAILFRKKLPVIVNDVIYDTNGRYLICRINYQCTDITIVCLYAPNSDDPSFFQEIFNKMEGDGNLTIIGGDFNLVQDCQIDSKFTRTHNNINSLEVIEKFKNRTETVDPWRELNPEGKSYTYIGNGARNMSRIDFFLISQELMSRVENTKAVAGYRSDHSQIELSIQLQENVQGPGLWKLNTTLLEEEDYKKEIIEVIERANARYCHCNAKQKWELLKYDIIQTSRQYGKRNKQKERDNTYKYFQTLEALQEEQLKDDNPSTYVEAISHIQNQIELSREKVVQAAAFRCRAQWVKDGEKNSKYFFNLEKRNHMQKTMYQTRKDNGELITDPKLILDEQIRFYNKLYRYDPDTSFQVHNNFNTGISDEEKNEADNPITTSEINQAILDLNTQKTPGCDGLPVEFYRVFAAEIITLLHQMYIQCLFDGELGMTARRGVLTLIPKKGKNPIEIKNNRPLTMLNVDYKIYAKIIASRIEKTIEKLVDEQQTGFIKGRKIEHNILTTKEIIAYAQTNNIDAVIMGIDFEKCFDRLSFQAIYKTLEFFNYGPVFIQMVRLLYSNFELCTQNNGFTSRYITKGRGCNQGCPASPVIYVLCGQIMSLLIKNNFEIQGITIAEVISILSQFADDTSLFLTYDRITIDATVETLSAVEKNLGLKVSYDKTRLYRIGSLAKTNAAMYTTKNFIWTNDNIDTLGVLLDCSGQAVPENFSKISDKVEGTLKNWYLRKLTLTGKIQVINTLIASKFVYKMSVLQNFSPVQLNQANRIIRDFLWDQKPDKIPLHVLQLDYLQGGLRLVDLDSRQKALKTRWVFGLKSNTFLEEACYRTLCPALRENIWKCSVHPTDVEGKTQWHEILHSWAQVNYTIPDCELQVKQQLLWHNHNIKIGNRDVCWPRAIRAGVLTVNDLWCVNNNDFLPYISFCEQIWQLCGLASLL